MERIALFASALFFLLHFPNENDQMKWKTGNLNHSQLKCMKYLISVKDIIFSLREWESQPVVHTNTLSWQIEYCEIIARSFQFLHSSVHFIPFAADQVCVVHRHFLYTLWTGLHWMKSNESHGSSSCIPRNRNTETAEMMFINRNERWKVHSEKSHWTFQLDAIE